jgi:hypothetical protein
MPELLRAEVRRLHQIIRTTPDPNRRRALAEEALWLAQQAEAIENLPDDVERLCVTMNRYSNRLIGTDDSRKQRVLEQLLQSAEQKLQRINGTGGVGAIDQCNEADQGQPRLLRRNLHRNLGSTLRRGHGHTGIASPSGPLPNPSRHVSANGRERADRSDPRTIA